MNAAAERHQARVRQLPCVPCLLIFGTLHNCEELHHPESVRDELSEFLVVPICIEMHKGTNGIHGLHRRGFERRYRISDLDMLAKTTELLS